MEKKYLKILGLTARCKSHDESNIRLTPLTLMACCLLLISPPLNAQTCQGNGCVCVEITAGNIINEATMYNGPLSTWNGGYNWSSQSQCQGWCDDWASIYYPSWSSVGEGVLGIWFAFDPTDGKDCCESDLYGCGLIAGEMPGCNCVASNTSNPTQPEARPEHINPKLKQKSKLRAR